MRSLVRQNQQLLHRARLHGNLKHPRARKIKQIQKTIRRNTEKQKVYKNIHSRRNAQDDQLFWLATALQKLGDSPVRQSYQDQDSGGLLDIVMEALVHIYLKRQDDELRALKERRQPPHGQIKKINVQQEAEETLFKSSKGFAVPPYSTMKELKATMEWLNAVFEFEKAHDENIAATDEKDFKIPHLHPVSIRRTSVVTSRKGNEHPTEQFLALVDQLKTKEGIGQHLLDHQQDDDGDEEDDEENQNEGSRKSSSSTTRKRHLSKKLRFSKKRLASSSSNAGDIDGQQQRLMMRGGGAKTLRGKDLAVAGMARRLEQAKTGQQKRRDAAMSKLRKQADSSDDDDEII